MNGLVPGVWLNPQRARTLSEARLFFITSTTQTVTLPVGNWDLLRNVFLRQKASTIVRPLPRLRSSQRQIITALAAQNDWELGQTDVDGAYLNAPLTETIYMRQPKGYEIPGKEHYVCRLNRALYGLKQTGQEWYSFLCRLLFKLGCTRCRVEHTIF